MKKINNYNKILIITTVIILILVIYKIVSYRASDRYCFIASVSAPKEFPVNIIRMWLYSDDKDCEEYGSYNFDYDDIESINSFESGWNPFLDEKKEYDVYPRFLPNGLLLEYVDFHTQKYYLDTIVLPIEKTKAIFKQAKSKRCLQNVCYDNYRMGLIFHVGIANDGNIIIWLIGNKYQKELCRTHLNPKPFPKIVRENLIVKNRKSFIDSIFKEIPDSIKLELKSLKLNAQYKDSMPSFFRDAY